MTSDLIEQLAELSGKFALAGDEGYMFLVKEAADRIASLEAALAPFAKEAEAISKAHLDGHCTDLDTRFIAIGHLRRAARALDGGEG